MGHRNIEVKVEEVDYHRNGIGGEGFHIIKFQSRDDGEGEFQDMIGIVFEEAMTTAVFNRRLLGNGEIRFMHNSFRGDVFDLHLRRGITAWKIEQDHEFNQTCKILEISCDSGQPHKAHYQLDEAAQIKSDGGQGIYCPGLSAVL